MKTNLKSEAMKQAWKAYRKGYSKSWSDCLKVAWKAIKLAQKSIEETDNLGRNLTANIWVASQKIRVYVNKINRKSVGYFDVKPESVNWWGNMTGTMKSLI